MYHFIAHNKINNLYDYLKLKDEK